MQPNTSRLPRNAHGQARWDDTQVNYWTRGDRRALSFSNKRPRNERRSDREKNCDGNNQPFDRKSASAGQAKGNSGTPCVLHSYLDCPAKHMWAECSNNPANQKKPVKREQAYYAHDTRRLASDGPRNDNYRTDAASKSEDSSRRLVSSRRSGDSYADDNYAVSITPRKRVKLNPPARKKRRTIAMSDGSDDDNNDGPNKAGKSKDPLDLSDSN